MWRNVCIGLWAHSLASWAAFGVLWIDTLRQPGRPPLDGMFCLVFGITEGLAPIWLPISCILFKPEVGENGVLLVAAVYIPVAALTAVWRWHREQTRLHAIRRAAGQCARCGYNLCATPTRCPECGTAAAPIKRNTATV